MRILNVTFNTNNKFNGFQKRKISNGCFSNPIVCVGSQISLVPINSYVNKISFKGNQKANISKLQSFGYEVAKVDNGKLINKGKNIILRSRQDLIALSKTDTAWNKNFVLASNIDLKNEQFDGIGNLKKYFSGEFNGNGYIIKNLRIDKSNFNRVGFFRTCDNARIKNLIFENAFVSGKSEVGGLIGSSENDTVIENVKFYGNVVAKNVSGGLVGYSKNTILENIIFDGNITNVSQNNSIEENSIFTSSFSKDSVSDNMFFGGVVEIAESSGINAASVKAKISSTGVAGGLVGSANWVDVTNSVFKGDIKKSKQIGSLAAIAQNSVFSKSYSLNEIPLVGCNKSSDLKDCFSKIEFVNKDDYLNWDKSVWNIAPKKLPRLKSDVLNSSCEKIFLEDVNNDIILNNIKIGLNYVPPKSIKLKLSDMEPPKHYSENEGIIREIESCTDSKKLAKLFAYWTDGFRPGFNPEAKRHDEILLALVKNKHLDMNKKWNSNKALVYTLAMVGIMDEATMCTPLYVLSCLNKGYIFNEALKRDDVDPFFCSGSDNDLTAFDGLFRNPIVTNTFLLFNAKKPKIRVYVEAMKSKYLGFSSPDLLTNLLCKYPIEEFDYDESTNEISVPAYMLSELDDVIDIDIEGQKDFSTLMKVANSPDIPANYVDSLGNNILHIVADRKNFDFEEMVIYNLATKNGANVNLKNNQGKTPFKIALENKNDILGVLMLQNGVNERFETDAEGNNVLMVNVKYNNTPQALLILENIHKQGFSVNTRNKYAATSLIEAVKQQKLKQINYLLNNGAAVDLCDENGQTALHHAFINHDVNSIKMLMDNLCCLEVKDKMGCTPKDYWPECMEDENFKKLNFDAAVITQCCSGIENVESQAFNMTEINNNLKNYSDGMSFDVDKLKGRGAELEKSLIRLFSYLCCNTLDEEDADEILWQLVQTNNPYAKECLIKILKTQPVDVNKQNSNGETPLILALKSYQEARTNKEKLANMQIVKCLLDFGANVDIADNNQQTALHQAVFSNNIILLNEVLGKHPNINYTDINGYNPIQYLSDDNEDPMCKVYNIYAQKRALKK